MLKEGGGSGLHCDDQQRKHPPNEVQGRILIGVTSSAAMDRKRGSRLIGGVFECHLRTTFWGTKVQRSRRVSKFSRTETKFATCLLLYF